MLSDVWRFFLALCDWRAHLRLLTGRPAIDVVFVTNLRDEAERKRFFGNSVPALGHANGPRIHLNGVSGRVRGIFVTAEEMMAKEGRKAAKRQFIAAVAWAERKGARVVLLAASTKRLFGRDGADLKRLFPNMLFTIGDNGTAHMLCRDVDRALAGAGMSPESGSRVLVIGPYGILGREVTRHLVAAGYDVTGYGANETALAGVAEEFEIDTSTRIAAVGKVDAVVACTHSSTAKLSVVDVQSLRIDQRRLLVVDVAEPANLDIDTHAVCRPYVIRQDAGNAHAPALHYVLGALSWDKLMLSRGVVFGCFAEAMALFHAIHRRGRGELAGRDWFAVTAGNTAHAEEALTSVGFGLPDPRCFGAPVTGFDADLPAPSHDAPARRLGLMAWMAPQTDEAR